MLAELPEHIAFEAPFVRNLSCMCVTLRYMHRLYTCIAVVVFFFRSRAYSSLPVPIYLPDFRFKLARESCSNLPYRQNWFKAEPRARAREYIADWLPFAHVHWIICCKSIYVLFPILAARFWIRRCGLQFTDGLSSLLTLYTRAISSCSYMYTAKANIDLYMWLQHSLYPISLIFIFLRNLLVLIRSTALSIYQHHL